MSKTLVTRAEIAEKLGITLKQLSNFASSRSPTPIVLPPVIMQIEATFYYDPDAAEAFIKANPTIGEKKTWPRRLSPRRSTFDNALAQAFITRRTADEAVTLAALADKHCKRGGKTVVVHLYERNDYVPPHPGLSKAYNSSGEHRFCEVFNQY